MKASRYPGTQLQSRTAVLGQGELLHLQDHGLFFIPRLELTLLGVNVLFSSTAVTPILDNIRLVHPAEPYLSVDGLVYVYGIFSREMWRKDITDVWFTHAIPGEEPNVTRVNAFDKRQQLLKEIDKSDHLNLDWWAPNVRPRTESV